jgi:hypothetical protein
MIRFLLLALILAQGTPVRLPEPGRKETLDAERSVRNVFNADYSRKTPELPVKLFRTALATSNDSTTRFVLLRESKDLAALAGNAVLACQALDVLIQEFEVDRKALVASLCGVLARTVQAPAGLKLFSRTCLRWTEDFITTDDYEAAAQALSHSEGSARKAKDADLLALVQMKAKELSDTKREYSRAKAAENILKERPNDASARADIGGFLCFYKQDWSKGLPFLDQSPDAALKALCIRDLANPSSPEDKLELGEAWLAWSDKQGAAKSAARERAISWLRSAWPDLAGLPREKLRFQFRAFSERLDGKGKGAPGLPRSWLVAGLAPTEKLENVAVDETYAHSGRRSVRIGPASKGIVATERVAVRAGRKFQVSFWAFSDGAEDLKTECALLFVSAADASTGIVPIPIPGDRPWWHRIEETVTCPPETAFVRFTVSQRFKQGRVWLDDVSIKDPEDGTEIVENGGAEEPR